MVSIEEEQSQEDLQCLHQLPLLGLRMFMKLIWQFFVRNAVISHLGIAVWVMAAQLCQLEVPAKPRSALQSSLECQNCKNSLEDPGR